MTETDWVLLVGVGLVAAAWCYCWLRPMTGFRMGIGELDNAKDIREWRWRLK